MNFLIRTKENRISGPFPKEVILARMQSGELREMDEVCPSSGYWIYLHERDESLRMLGVALARTEDFHEENTETDTETVTATQPTSAPFAAHTAKDMMREARDAVNSSSQGNTNADSVANKSEHSPVPPTEGFMGNRPEAIKAIKFVLLVFGFLIAFILLRIYQLANPV
jgi:hypothetical protein